MSAFTEKRLRSHEESQPFDFFTATVITEQEPLRELQRVRVQEQVRALREEPERER